MNKIDNHTPEQKEKSVAYWIGLFVLYLIMAAFSTGFIINGLLAYLFNSDPETITLFLTDPHLFEGKQAVFVGVQGLSSLLLFVGGAYFFIKRENGFLYNTLTNPRNTTSNPFVLPTVLLVILALPTFSLIGEINEEVIKGLLDAKGLEKLFEIDAKTSALYDYLLSVTDIPLLLLSIVGIAIIPGVGEELVFRGVFQNLFKKATQNKHIAIWLSAFIFSSIHFEFSNFVARLLIGGLFGYMYEWTKNIYIPIIAHAVYNSISLVLGYLFANDLVDSSLNESSLTNNTWMYMLLYSVVPISLLYVYYKKTNANVV